MKNIKKVTFYRREYIDKHNFIESQLTRCFLEYWYSDDEQVAYFRQSEDKIFELDANVIVCIEE